MSTRSSSSESSTLSEASRGRKRALSGSPEQQTVNRQRRSYDNSDESMDSDSDSDSEPVDANASKELALIADVASDARDNGDHELRTAPLVTREAYLAAGGQRMFPQYGLLGNVISTSDSETEAPDKNPNDSRIYVNTNAPFSALVCGVQGSGKSHTVAIMLENMLIPNMLAIGSLEKPLSGLVLHFGEGGPETQPSEAAWVGSPKYRRINVPSIVVYVSPSHLKTMRTVYAKVGRNIKVEPLIFDQSELDAKAFLALMAVNSSESAPLYMHHVLSILRELGEEYSYAKYLNKLDLKKKDMNPLQINSLNQRMELLGTFVDKNTDQARPIRFAQGMLTIVDLSDPYIDSVSACGFFEIMVRLFVRAKVGTGKVLVVDEAHKYLAASKGNSGLTKELSSLVRQQRHQGMRVIISTQEPTVVPPVLLDLCSVAVLHRFSSPSWLTHVEKHVAARMDGDEAFNKVARLKTGQAIVLAPSALGLANRAGVDEPCLEHCGRNYFLVKTR